MWCAQDDPQGAVQLLDRALAGYHPEVDAFDRGRTFLVKSRLAPNQREREEARRQALYVFRRLGAATWAAQLEQPTRERNDGIGGLTDSEYRVLTEVAKGLTNQQVALKQLNLSVKTVANHLYHAYRKLGVASRTEAARVPR